jgi:hypothetical protein
MPAMTKTSRVAGKGLGEVKKKAFARQAIAASKNSKLKRAFFSDNLLFILQIYRENFAFTSRSSGYKFQPGMFLKAAILPP